MRIETSLAPITPRPVQMQTVAVPTADPQVPATPAADPVEPQDPTTSPTTPAPAPEPRFEKASGMLEKLADGHFNPVAALRHQIKNADALREAGVSVPEPAAAPKGKAYAKFLEQYRAMQPQTPAAGDPVAQSPAPTAPAIAETAPTALDLAA